MSAESLSGWQLTKIIFTTNPFKAKATLNEHIAKEIQKCIIALIICLGAVGFAAYFLNAYYNVMTDLCKGITIVAITGGSIAIIIVLAVLISWIKEAKVNRVHDPIAKYNALQNTNQTLLHQQL